MKSTGIPLPYKIILKYLWYKSEMGRIKIKEVRTALSWYFRMGKENWNDIFNEMKRDGYIICRKGSGPSIEIVPQLKDLV